MENRNVAPLSPYLQLLRLIGNDSSVSYLQEVSEICNVYSVIELLFTEFAECKTQWVIAFSVYDRDGPATRLANISIYPITAVHIHSI